MDPNFPLTLIDWKLTSIQGIEDKYDKNIIGKVKNNSKRNLSEVRIEFTVYDEREAKLLLFLKILMISNPARFGTLKCWLHTMLKKQS
jgi:hypothetical protein